MSCLPNIPEIQLQIFELLFTTEDGHRDLAVLARTCRAFHAIAIYILWRTQTSLVPLVLCFPREILDISRCRDSDRDMVVTFLRPPSLQDWERPLIHAEFIRDLGQWPGFKGGHKEYHLTSSSLKAFFDSCPTSPLLPNLRRLDCHRIFPRFQCVASEARVASAYVFKISAPTVIESLRLHYNIFDRRQYNGHASLVRILERHSTIKSLSIAYVADDSGYYSDLAVVGSLQCLTSFTFSGYLNMDVCLIPAFPAILELELIRITSSSALAILKAILSPGLREIRISLLDSHQQPALCTVMASRGSWQKSIQSISFVKSTMYNVSSQDFEALLPLRYLIHVDVWCTTLDDHLLERAAKAWPMLEYLSILYRHKPDSRRPFTLQSLFSFSRYCPHLRYLSLPLGARQITSPLVDTSWSETGHASLGEKAHETRLLLEVTMTNWVPMMARDPVAVGGLLLRLFPGLTLKLGFDKCDHDRSGWGEVVRIIDESRQEGR